VALPALASVAFLPSKLLTSVGGNISP
jgi:hypothetical protein